MNLNPLKAENEERWIKANILPVRQALVDEVATRLLTGKPRYQVVEQRAKVPWQLIAVIHEREASGSWAANLANGDPWNHVTIHVPRGRGPFASWEDAAVDALVDCPPFAAKNTDWSVGGALTLLEEYNGLGYYVRGLPSPYLWASTDQYIKGKYIADGHFDPNVVDTQIGCAAILKAMHWLDTNTAPVVAAAQGGQDAQH